VTPELICGTTENQVVPGGGVHPVFPMTSCQGWELNKLKGFFFLKKNIFHYFYIFRTLFWPCTGDREM